MTRLYRFQECCRSKVHTSHDRDLHARQADHHAVSSSSACSLEYPLKNSTVMDALHNIENQEIFKMAREADETGERTVGVITKSDAVAPGDEEEVLWSNHIESRPVLIYRYSRLHATTNSNFSMVGSRCAIFPLWRRTRSSPWRLESA
jgi:hypothetical protein